MFLIFQLDRPDVLAVGDLGVRRAVERAYGLPDLPSADELERAGRAVAPYRAAACRLLWHSLSQRSGDQRQQQSVVARRPRQAMRS